MSVTVLPMTVEHLGEASQVHLEAFRGYMNSRFGVRYAPAFLAWFVAAERGIALAAVSDTGRVVGYVAGAPDGYSRSLTRALLPVAAGSVLLRPWILFDRAIVARGAARLAGLFRPAPAGPRRSSAETMALVAIGVASDARGLGVGATLLGQFEARARAMGMAAVRLSVYADNVAARRLYERAGWSVVRTEGRAIYLGRRLT